MDDSTVVSIEALEEWARKHATSQTGRFDEEAVAAEIALSFIDTDRIGHGA